MAECFPENPRWCEYLAIDSGGYLCINSLHALIAAWLNAFQRIRDGEYLAIDSGGNLCINSLHALIAAWLNAFQRIRDGVRLNRCARQ